MKWSPDSYLKEWLKSVHPEYTFTADSHGQWQEWRAKLRSRLIELLGGFPAHVPELDPDILESVDCGTYVRQRLEITTYPNLRMPVYVLIPKQVKNPGPAVIACHGHGYGSREIVGLSPDGSPRSGDPGYQKDFALELVERGYLTIVPDLLGFGDRKLDEDNGKDNSCHRISTFLLAMGNTMAGHRVFEALRCVDYLESRTDVDKNRIGIMGISGGGLVGTFAAAVDDRIQAAVISGFANTFEASILSIYHCVDNYVPGLSLAAEMSDLLALIAPKPLLIEAGRQDPIFPVDAVEETYNKLEMVYGLLHARDQLDLDLFEGEHQISGTKAYSWFERMV